MQFHEEIYHFYNESYNRDIVTAINKLKAGSFEPLDSEVVVWADGGVTAVYVMPETLHQSLVRGASELVTAIAATGRSLTMPSTALHRNETSNALVYYTFGNLTGKNSLLFAEQAHPSFAELAGKKLKNVRMTFDMPHPGVAIVTSFEWEFRE
jgi:hypothetical protein